MTENARTLKCPACGATIEPPQGQSTMKCSYCQSVIEIPVVAPAPVAPRPYNPAIDQIKALIRSGDRMKVVNFVRELTGNTSLQDAVDIVEAIERGEQVDL